MTKYEKAIYDVVTASREHLTAGEIYKRIKGVLPKVVQATVYNNLNKLTESGFIRRISVEGMPDRYDAVHKHDHLVCSKCGKITDVSFDDITLPLQKQLGQGFLFYDLKVYYVCPECRAKAKSNEI
ncbi:MAG: Fur family transcriptional regulator [Christensenellaceae bacterium]